MKYKIALILTAAMVMLAGCSKQDTEVSDTAAAEAVTSAAESAAAEDESEPAETTASSAAAEGEFIDYIMGGVNLAEVSAEDVLDKLIADNIIDDGIYVLGWSAEVVSDGIHSVKEGLIELYHIEGTLDISLPFTDILNQKSEQEQIETLNAVAKAYKDAFNVDIVRITCNGESVITDDISYDEMVLAEIEKLAQDVEDVEPDEAYEEEE